MAIFVSIILSILILQASSKAAPSSDVAKNFDIVKSIEDGPKLNDELYSADENIKVQKENESNGRQKRYYDYVEFGIPPFFESSFPFPSRFNYNKRDESQNTGVYGSEDTLLYILRSLQRILNDARRQQSTPKPTPVHVPTYIPVFYLPQAACNCPNNTPPAPVNNTTNNNNNNNNKQQPPPPTIAPSTEEPSSIPDLPNRFMTDDMRPTWGTATDPNGPSENDNDSDYDDGNRPISLDPIEVPESLDIPAPPVEHGSVQAGAEPQTTTTTMKTLLESDRAPNNKGQEMPSLCDAAIVSCCVRKTVTYNCFAQQGCPDPSFYGNPCEPQTFRQVLNRVHAYVKQRNG